MAVTLFLTFHVALKYIPYIKVDPSVSLGPYILCILSSTVVSARFLETMTTRFHRLTWVHAAQLTTRQMVLMALFVFTFVFAFKDPNMSRLFLGTYLMLAWIMLLFVNAGLPRFLSRLMFGPNRRMPTLFIGGLQKLEGLRSWLASRESLGLQPVGFLSNQGHPLGGSNPPFLGGTADLPRLIDSRQVVQVIVLGIPIDQAETSFIIETCQARGCRLLFHTDYESQFRHPVVAVSEEGHQFYTLQNEPLEDPLNRVLKRTFDLTLSLPVVFFLLPPLILLVWVMQRLQAPGPVFLSQNRTGQGQRSFRLIKFRSMYFGSSRVADETKQAKRHDTRVFPFGRFMRSSSLDEFPQFINVLKGEMSIVGPRPHLAAHDRI